MIKNLISLSRLLETDQYAVKFDRLGCRLLIRKDHTQVDKAILQGRLYAFHLQPPRAVPSVRVTARSAVGDVDPSMLWHARLGHINEKKLVSINASDEQYRHKLPLISKLEFCDSCACGKIKQAPYSKTSAYKATELLELVHMDLCGPISTPSLAGSRYFMPFIDNCSRMTFVYYLKHKSEALLVFQTFLSMAKRQTGKKFWKLHTDGAGELTSSDFVQFCQDRGILK